MNFVWDKRTGVDWLDKIKKNDLTINKFEDNNDQTLIFKKDDDRFILMWMDMRFLRSSALSQWGFVKSLMFQEK